MYPATFEYHRPGSVDEAVRLLSTHKDDAKLLAGGHSLVPIMKLRLATPKHVIDLRKISGLAGIREEGGALVMKAELPGMKKEEIEVGIVEDVLTISGKKEKEEKVERKDYLRYERSTGAFTRRVKLPAPVLIDKVTAKYENGVLEIRAPKADPAKSAGHKVAIT